MTALDDSQLKQQLEQQAQMNAAWQNQLLAEMGITRWVSQTCPVKTFDTLSDLSVIFEHQNAVIQPTNNSTAEPPVLLSDQHKAFATQNITAQPVIHNEDTITTGLDDFDDSSAPTATQTIYAHDLQSEFDENDDLRTTNFDLQAIVVGDWTLVVDSSHLQRDHRQLQLWQQISSNLKSHVHFFKFPLLGDSHQLPNTTLQLMSSYKMAEAGFSGFLFGINQHRTGQTTHKVGALTLLPDCLAEQPIQRLPYLDEMLEDYRLKRQLWQLLSS